MTAKGSVAAMCNCLDIPMTKAALLAAGIVMGRASAAKTTTKTP